MRWNTRSAKLLNWQFPRIFVILEYGSSKLRFHLVGTAASTTFYIIKQCSRIQTLTTNRMNNSLLFLKVHLVHRVRLKFWFLPWRVKTCVGQSEESSSQVSGFDPWGSLWLVAHGSASWPEDWTLLQSNIVDIRYPGMLTIVLHYLPLHTLLGHLWRPDGSILGGYLTNWADIVALSIHSLKYTFLLLLLFQDGAQAGQTVPHVHVHILPRKSGDFENNDEVYDVVRSRPSLSSPFYLQW